MTKKKRTKLQLLVDKIYERFKEIPEIKYHGDFKGEPMWQATLHQWHYHSSRSMHGTLCFGGSSAEAALEWLLKQTEKVDLKAHRGALEGDWCRSGCPLYVNEMD